MTKRLMSERELLAHAHQAYCTLSNQFAAQDVEPAVMMVLAALSIAAEAGAHRCSVEDVVARVGKLAVGIYETVEQPKRS